MMVGTYLRRGQRKVEHLALHPGVRSTGRILAYGGGGFLLSAAGISGFAQPLAIGLVCAGTGWRALVMGLGVAVGYPLFWGAGGLQGIVWAAAAGLLALLLGKREETQEQPLMIPSIAAFLTAVTGLVFRLLLGDKTPFAVYALRTFLTFGSGVLFTQASRCRDSLTDWLTGAVTVLALAQAAPRLGLGYIAAAAISSGGGLPAAALAGLGLDLARVTQLPMTAVLCAGSLLQLYPFRQRWKHFACAGFACLGAMAVWGIWEKLPVVGLFLGGALGAVLPQQPQSIRRRGDTGVAQVRLELGAEVLAVTGQFLGEGQSPPADQDALLARAGKEACDGCAAGKNCSLRGNLTGAMLLNPLEADCRNQDRLVPALERAGEQLRILQADHRRREEYRRALEQQYRFLSSYLRQLADSLPRRHGASEILFRVETAARSRGKEKANGDRCLAFQGSGAVFYLLLCDGMGTGLGAARDGQDAAKLLQKMLMAGFPAEHALQSMNSLLVLEGKAGAVTIDLAEVRLDTGIATVYKWGAAPSWVISRRGTEKIGTAMPPPGISLDEKHQAVEKLSLRRGEALILLSDGLDGEDVLNRLGVTPEAPPGELAADILEKGCDQTEDDVTAAVIRLLPVNLGVS